jgi:hypothetical protein
VRCRLLLALPLAAAAFGFAQSVPPAAASSNDCRKNELRVHDQAVFGHFATHKAAAAFARRPIKYGFKGVEIENNGCGDFEVYIGGADKTSVRDSFAAEAAKGGFQVTFDQTAPPLTRTSKLTYGVFGTFRSIARANALSWRLARAGFRYIAIAYDGGKWLVVMPQVPIKVALSIASEAAHSGFHIAFQS